MLTYLEAQKIIASLSRSFGIEQVNLDDTDGRVLAENAYADRDYPPFNRAAMDGYAINLSDWERGTRTYKIQQVIYAGENGNKDLTPGCCYQIMTGAPVPLSANVVIRREDATQDGQTVTFNIESIRAFQSIARQGEDAKKGDLMVGAGQRCTPATISMLASISKGFVSVEKLPRVALITTGNEVVDINSVMLPNQIRNSNQYLIKSLLKKWLIKPAVCAHVLDIEDDLMAAIRGVLDHDIIITCGGVSAGDADYLPSVFEQLGITKLFHKVAIRPGKPIWCGQMPNGGLAFGLPGNPFSGMVGFKLFVESYLYASFKLDKPITYTLPFNGSRTNKSGLDEIFPVKLSGEPLTLRPLSLNGSGDIRLGLGADALAIHPGQQHLLSEGAHVEAYLL
jgi:molybdopterin molybdotransferase